MHNKNFSRRAVLTGAGLAGAGIASGASAPKSRVEEATAELVAALEEMHGHEWRPLVDHNICLFALLPCRGRTLDVPDHARLS